MSLAIGSYERLGPLTDGSDHLNLAWTQDERALLDADVRRLVVDELGAEVAEGLPYADAYLVKDPYGEGEMSDSVAAFFGKPDWDVSVTCGAGVGPLLHALGPLARDATVRVVSDVYPDYPHWAGTHGGTCVGADSGGQPTVILLERPSLTGGPFDDLDRLRELCAQEARAVVLVDESNANYCPAPFSAANLAPDVDNLIVVRGLSKAYGLGSLRLGYCVASAALTDLVRRFVPPLQASSLSLRIGRKVLQLGDVAATLRDRIDRHKTVARDLVAGAGLGSARGAAGHLPYVLVPDQPQRAVDLLAARGVQAKQHPVWDSRRGGLRTVGRISVPLQEERLAELARRLRH